LLDARCEIVAFLEVDVDDMVTADHSVKRHGTAIDVDALECWNFSRERHDVVRNLLKILQLAG